MEEAQEYRELQSSSRQWTPAVRQISQNKGTLSNVSQSYSTQTGLQKSARSKMWTYFSLTAWQMHTPLNKSIPLCKKFLKSSICFLVCFWIVVKVDFFLLYSSCKIILTCIPFWGSKRNESLEIPSMEVKHLCWDLSLAGRLCSNEAQRVQYKPSPKKLWVSACLFHTHTCTLKVIKHQLTSKWG